MVVAIKVLVAVHSVSIRKMLSFALRMVGFEVAEAVSEGQAQAQAQACRPGLIITGLNMPHFDGVRLVRSLRAYPGLGRVPILLLSGEPSDQVRMGIQAGATGWIGNSVKPDELISAIRRILD